MNSIHHVVSGTALMLVAGDVLGKRRIWPAAIGLVIGAWTRQLTVLYFPAVLWAAWRDPRHRAGKIAMASLALAVAGGVSMTLNAMKFGCPFDTGYRHIYAGRSDMYAQRYLEHHHIFDPRYIPRNFAAMNLELPSVSLTGRGLTIGSEGEGVSIWITSPLLVFAVLFARRWWHDPARRALMLSSLVVAMGILMYHTTGSIQYGIFRYAMDFIPVWLVVIAPWAVEKRFRNWTLVCMAWSLAYFHLVCASQMAP